MTVLRSTDLADDALLTAGCCVIGAGPAGITVARTLAAAGIETVVLESGGPEPGGEGQELANGEVEGDLSRRGRPGRLGEVRLRGLGGTSGHWGGLCARFDAIDLAPRPELGRVGWPFGLDELDLWYDIAHDTVELRARGWDPQAWLAARGIQVPLATADVRTGLYRMSPPTRFGESFRPELDASERCTVVLDATVVGLETTPDRGHVRRVAARSLGGHRVSVDAPLVVLAGGAIELARLLLLTGLANSSGLVGVGYMDHPHVRIGRLALAAEWRGSMDRGEGGAGYEGSYGWPTLTPTTEALTERGLLNAALALDSWEAELPDGRLDPGVRSLVGPDAVLDQSTVTIRAEQAPVPSNRVLLGSALDPFGMPVARLEWWVDPVTTTSFEAVAHLVATELGRAGVGRLQIARRPRVGVGPHHMGTARMSDDPATGVVDRDGRAHDVDNLYVASGATFPTSGHANPTLTIVALAHRLGDHLARLVTGRPAPPLPPPAPAPPATGGP